MAPGTISMMTLSTMVIDRIDNVSAAKTNLKALMNDSLALISGIVDTVQPDVNAKTDAKITVACGVNPACVPMVTPSISPIMQPAKQCKVAANAMRLVEVFVLQ